MKRYVQRCSLFLGILAMLGALVAVPLNGMAETAMAGTQSSRVSSHVDSRAAHDMPCHKPAKPPKPCPGCPQNTCSDNTTCLVKCFQKVVPPLVGTAMLKPSAHAQARPAAQARVASSLVPPLLRPPSA